MALCGFRGERGEAVDERRSEAGVQSTERVRRELGDEPLGEVATEGHGETIDDGPATARVASVDLGNVCKKPGDRRGVGGYERGDAHHVEYAHATEGCASLARGKRVTRLRDVVPRLAGRCPVYAASCSTATRFAVNVAPRQTTESGPSITISLLLQPSVVR